MTLRDQIRSDPGRICSRMTAWDLALRWGTGEFVIVLDSCCISIGLVFIKDRPVSSFWVLRFRSRVPRFRDLGVFVFRVLGASFSSFGCFIFEIWVLCASVFIFECFVFETTGFRRYLSSSNSGVTCEFANMPNSLGMLVHILEFNCIHKP